MTDRLSPPPLPSQVAKLAVEGPIHKMEIRRARCFKDSVAVFSGKGHSVWRQPLKVTFVGEAGMDSGGVTREWFCSLSSAISRNSPDLFWNVGPQKNQLYVSPLSNTPSHLKKFQFVGMFMAKVRTPCETSSLVRSADRHLSAMHPQCTPMFVHNPPDTTPSCLSALHLTSCLLSLFLPQAILESAARSKELGTITLNLSFCEPFWKLLLGIPLNLMDLQLLDPTEFRLAH